MVPQYLLNTTLGSEYAREHKRLRLSPSAHVINLSLTQNHPDRIFSENEALDQMIEKKLKYKLADFGLLGNSPFSNDLDKYRQTVSSELASQDHQIDKQRLVELYGIVKHQLVDEDKKDDNDKLMHSEGISGPPKRAPFSSENVGEIYMDQSAFKIPQDGEVDLGRLSLKSLLLAARLERFRSFFPNVLEKEELIPTRWIPVCSAQDIAKLSESLSLQISGPYSNVIGMSTKEYVPAAVASEEATSLFFNFVGDRSVDSRLGLFYYEVQVSQECNGSSHFKPLIPIIDSSSSPTMSFSMGYTSETPVLVTEKSTLNSNVIVGERIDLSGILRLLKLFSPNSQTSLLRDLDTVSSMRPGVSQGTFAINFEDRSFHDSSSNPQNPRSSVLAMNRRLSPLHRQLAEESDAGKTHLHMMSSGFTVEDDKQSKIYKTDTIGCGVNFINNSVFITFNGIRVKEFDASQLSSYNPLKQAEKVDLYPIFGFSVANLKEVQLDGDRTSVTITTNFGQEPFKFDINSYSLQLKLKNDEQLDSLFEGLKQKAQDTASGENTYLLACEDTSLNTIIKSYLAQGAYLDTLAAFESDTEAQDSMNLAPWVTDNQKEFIERSKAQVRKVVRNLLLSSEFDKALEVISQVLGVFRDTKFNSSKLAFDIKFMNYKYLINSVINKKLEYNSDEFSFQNRAKTSLKQEWEDVLKYGQILLSNLTTQDFSERQEVIKASNLLLLDDYKSLNSNEDYASMIGNYTTSLHQLAWNVNDYLVKSCIGDAKIEHASRLEALCRDVHSQIKLLATTHDDERFQMINFVNDFVNI